MFLLYASLEGREIPLHVYGPDDAAETVLVMAGVHGDEGPSLAFGRALVAHLDTLPATAFRHRLLVMPVVNPDGASRDQRKNAAGIDLNRNWPTADFGTGNTDPSARYYGGDHPLSEPEAKAVGSVVWHELPDRIFSVHAPLEMVNYDGPATEWAEAIAADVSLPPESDIGYKTPGSMGTFFGDEHNVPIITYELPPDVDVTEPKAWTKYGQPVLKHLGIRGDERGGWRADSSRCGRIRP